MTTTYVLYFEHGSKSFRHTITKIFNDRNATQVIRNMIKYFERLEKEARAYHWPRPIWIATIIK